MPRLGGCRDRQSLWSLCPLVTAPELIPPGELARNLDDGWRALETAEAADFAARGALHAKASRSRSCVLKSAPVFSEAKREEKGACLFFLKCEATIGRPMLWRLPVNIERMRPCSRDVLAASAMSAAMTVSAAKAGSFGNPDQPAEGASDTSRLRNRKRAWRGSEAPRAAAEI